MHGQTRRQLLKTAVGTAGIVLVGRDLLAAQTPALKPDAAETLRLADDLYVIRIPGQANIVAHTNAAGVLLVDGGSAAAADAVMKAVADLPHAPGASKPQNGQGAGPIHTLFNTHWHPEQTGLNEQVGKAGGTIIAQENTRLWLATDITWPWNGQRFKRLPKVAQPNKTFYDAGQLDAGIRYAYLPDAAHTDGDLYMFFTQQNVLAVGDVVSAEGWPAVDWVTGGWIGGIVGAMQRLVTIANQDTRIVPGRGPVLGLADLKTQFEMYAAIYDRLTGLLNKGRSPSEAVAAQPTKEFDEKMGNGDEFVRRSFESLWAYLSPDA
jgi:cyclase